MPKYAQRKHDGRGRGPNERASIALGSSNLDKLATRGERNGTDTAKQVRFLVECLLEGKLFMANGMGEIVHLRPEGGCSAPCAAIEGSPATFQPLPKIVVTNQRRGERRDS